MEQFLNVLAAEPEEPASQQETTNR